MEAHNLNQDNNKYIDNILDVPYYSQYLDIDDKMNAVGGCGMTCIKMLLDFYKKENMPLSDWVDEGKSEGGYSKSGWVHDYFVEVLNTFNLNSHREEKMGAVTGVAQIITSIKNGNPVICSVMQKLFNYNNYHMVLITGIKVDANSNLVGLFYHDPASTSADGGKNKYTNLEDFKVYWRGMAIFVNPNHENK